MKHTILPDNKFLQTVRPVIVDALEQAENILPSSRHMQITVNYTEDTFVSETMGGSTGRSDNASGFEVSVNTNVDGWRQALLGSVVHEYNHAIWFHEHNTAWDTMTVRDNIALEGLALCFEEHFIKGVPKFARAISREEAQEVWDKLEPHFGEPADDWTLRAWIAGNDEFPLWAGYTLSYLVINQAKEKLNLTWPELIKLETDILVERI